LITDAYNKILITDAIQALLPALPKLGFNGFNNN